MQVKGFLELLRLTKLGDKQQTDDENRWSGIAFQMQQQNYVVPLGEVSEIIYCPVLTPVPNSERWLKGLANVRGQLITVIDLAEYLFSTPSKRVAHQQKLLCLKHQDHYIGLFVDQVLGIQHFNKRNFFASSGNLEQVVEKYCSGHFSHNQLPWHVFLFSEYVKDFQHADAVLN